MRSARRRSVPLATEGKVAAPRNAPDKADATATDVVGVVGPEGQDCLGQPSGTMEG